MSRSDSFNHVDDNELILRRIPIRTGWYDPDSGSLSRAAFRPTKRDVTGLSVSRAHSEAHENFLTPQQDAALGSNSSGYYVAVLRVGDLRKHRIEVVARPNAANPGHAEIPLLSYDSRKSDTSVEATERLAEMLVLRVDGPFPPEQNDA